MKQFLKISKRMKVGKVKYVPGERDAGLDGGALYREFMGESNSPSTTLALVHRAR